MPATDALYNVLQAQQQLNLTGAQAQDTQALAQARLFALSQQRAMQQILMQQLQGQGNNTPGVNGQPEPTVVPGQPGPGGYAADGPMGIAMGQAQKLSKQADEWGNLSRLIMPFNPEAGRQLGASAIQARNDAAGKVLDVMKEGISVDKQLGGLAGAVADAAQNGDQERFIAGLQQMAALKPGALRSIPLETDANGMPIASPRNAKSLQNYSLGSLNAAEQSSEKQRQATLAETISRDRQTAAIAAENAQTHRDAVDANVALRTSQQAATAAQREQTNLQRQVSQATTINNQYENQSKDFKDVVPRVQAATSYLIDPQTGKMKDNSQFNSSGDRMFAEAFIKTVYPDYRGSVYDQKSLSQLQGLPDKIVQGIKNIATGQMLPRDVKADMYGAMQQSFKPMNEMQIQREDAAQARAIRSGVPEDMTQTYIPPYALRPSQKQATPVGAPKYKEGDTASGPNGSKMIFKGGQWQPM